MQSARVLGRSFAVAAGAALMCGIMPGVSQASSALAANACGRAFDDYTGTFTGTALIGNGPSQITYTLTFPKRGVYAMQLEASGTSGTHEAMGSAKIQSTDSVGNLVLTVPVFRAMGPPEFMEVTTRDTQCESGLLGATPPTVTGLTFSTPGGPEIVMRRTA
ncbi:hypothetical protein GCM10010425_59830 [Streptomyces spororaveus]|uniref:Uncharacterized protein n=1 Tax=Streptomyces spororaveus TaxID=284039 RepID=A0ABQ3T6Y6_9ACTN|nr:hypothetical protein [Streptomyces spororaveus]GHI76146.1 hypothetical protein Sspor_17070 [Streptomyces spororaveus]